MGRATLLAAVSLFALVACGGSAFEAGSGDAGSAGHDATSGADAISTGDGTGGDGPATSDSFAPCLGTKASCGAAGQCAACSGLARGPLCMAGQCGCNVNADCIVSLRGTACVAGVCGCEDPVRDCAAGYACGADNVCTKSCAGGVQCNGCCDGTSCQHGDANGACGAPKSTCQVCGGMTPTCHQGACSGACGSANDGTCGSGSCCNAGTCADGTMTSTCGASGQACVNCNASTMGRGCVGGVCGCNVATDCPLHTACVNNKCGTTCSSVDHCNGGCCASGSCVAMCGTAAICCPNGTCSGTGGVCP